MKRVDLQELLKRMEGQPEFYGCEDMARRADRGGLWATPLYRLPARWDRRAYANAYIDVTPDGYHPTVGDPTPGTVLRLPANPRWIRDGLTEFLEGRLMQRLHRRLMSKRSGARKDAVDEFMYASLAIPRADVVEPKEELGPWLAKNRDGVYVLHHTAVTCDRLEDLFEFYPETDQLAPNVVTIYPGLWRYLVQLAIHNTPLVAAGACVVG